MAHEFSPEELSRYSRHLSLPGFGRNAQQRLADSSVLIIGAGGLGSPVALYLAASGVGHITIADGDNVDLSNLQRQIIHATADVGRPKAISAAEKMMALNPEIRVTPLTRFISEDEIEPLILAHDFIIDATDSPEGKFLIDAACARCGKAYSHGAIFQYEGHTMTILPSTARLTDLFPEGPVLSDRPQPVGSVGRRAGNSRHHSGNRSHQISYRRRRTPHRSPSALRHSDHAVLHHPPTVTPHITYPPSGNL